MALYAVDRGYIDDKPTPTPKPTVVNAIVIEETEDRHQYPDLVAILFSPEVRNLFPEFRIIDPDDEVSELEQELKQRGIEIGLPTLFLTDSTGKIWWEGEPPRTVEGWRNLRDQIVE